jgi:hypothetical protein
MRFQRLNDQDGKGDYVVGPSGKRIYSEGHIQFLETVGLLKEGEGIPEFTFDENRKWAFDWCWPEYKIAAEYEGNVYAGKKGHRSVGKFVKDMEKYNAAAIQGWCVIRGAAADVMNGQFGGQLYQAFDARERDREP